MQGCRCCQQEIRGCRGGPMAEFIPFCSAARGKTKGSPSTCGLQPLESPWSECVPLGTGTLHVMDVANHCRVTCTKGAAWVTGSNRPCDYILKAGESLLLQGRNRVIVSSSRSDTLVWICRD